METKVAAATSKKPESTQTPAAHAPVDPKPTTGGQVGENDNKPAAKRRRRGGAGGEDAPAARFFMGDKARTTGIPALTKECPTEADAVMAAYQDKQIFYRLEVFEVRPTLEGGRVVLEKVPVKQEG